MDGITEPVVLVLGHPVAGNPAQFALERAFESLGLQWRVLSCDVPPDRLDEAISGANILGFRGLLLDRNLCRPSGDAAERPDLYLRADRTDPNWKSEPVLSNWLESQIRDHFAKQDQPIGPLLSIGPQDPSFPAHLASEQNHSPIGWASVDAINHAKLIVLTETVDVSQWPECDGATLVIDFANPENDIHAIGELGYEVIGREQIRIGILTTSIQEWTGREPTEDVLVDAIEEYLAV
jgi:hypothetical protein